MMWLKITVFLSVFASSAYTKKHPACSVGELSHKSQTCSVKMFLDLAEIIQYELPDGCLTLPDWLETALLLPPEMANMTEMEKSLFFVNQKMNQLDKKLAMPTDKVSWSETPHGEIKKLLKELRGLYSTNDLDMLQEGVEHAIGGLSELISMLGEFNFEHVGYLMGLTQQTDGPPKYDEILALNKTYQGLEELGKIDALIGLPPQNMSLTLTWLIYGGNGGMRKKRDVGDVLGRVRREILLEEQLITGRVKRVTVMKTKGEEEENPGKGHGENPGKGHGENPGKGHGENPGKGRGNGNGHGNGQGNKDDESWKEMLADSFNSYLRARGLLMYPILMSEETDCEALHELINMDRGLSTAETKVMCTEILQQADELRKNNSLMVGIQSIREAEDIMLTVDEGNKFETRYREHYLETVKKLKDLAYFLKFAVIPWIMGPLAPATSPTPFIPIEVPQTRPTLPPGFVFTEEDRMMILDMLDDIKNQSLTTLDDDGSKWEKEAHQTMANLLREANELIVRSLATQYSLMQPRSIAQMLGARVYRPTIHDALTSLDYYDKENGLFFNSTINETAPTGAARINTTLHDLMAMDRILDLPTVDWTEVYKALAETYDSDELLESTIGPWWEKTTEGIQVTTTDVTTTEADTTTAKADTTTADAGSTTAAAGSTTTAAGSTTIAAESTTADAGTTTADAGTTTAGGGRRRKRLIMPLIAGLDEEDAILMAYLGDRALMIADAAQFEKEDLTDTVIAQQLCQTTEYYEMPDTGKDSAELCKSVFENKDELLSSLTALSRSLLSAVNMQVTGIYRIDLNDPQQEAYRDLVEQFVARFDEWLDIVYHIIKSPSRRKLEGRLKPACPANLTVEVDEEAGTYLGERHENITAILGDAMDYSWATPKRAILDTANKLIGELSDATSVAVCEVVPRVRGSLRKLKSLTKHLHPISITDIMDLHYMHSDVRRKCHGRPETGECRRYERRWVFVQATQRCEPFIYGGCQGNGNNHKTEKQCLSLCVRTDEKRNSTHVNIMPKSEIKPFLHELESFMDSLKELENVTGRGELDWTKQAFRKAANMLFDARRDMDKEHNYRKISDQKHPKGNESVEQDMKERKRRQNEATATTTESSTTTKNESSTTTTMPESSPTTTESETTTIGEVVELSLTRYIITWSMVITQVNQSDIDSDTAADTIAEYCRNHNASFSLYPDMGTDAESVCSAMFAIKSSDGVFANHNVVKMAHMIAAYVKEHIEMGGVVADLSDEERDYKHDVLQHAALEIKAVLRFYVEKMRVNLEEQNGIERRELLDDPSEKMMRDMFDDLEYIEYGMWERNSSGQDTEMYMAAYEGVEVENATEAESRRKRDSNSSAIINRIHRPTTHVHQKIDLPSPKSSPLLQLVTSVKRLFIQLPARLRREVTTQEAQGGEGEEDNMWNDMIDADKCGSYDNWLTPGLVDTIGAYEPSLVYLKNSFMLRWIAGVPDEVQIVMIKDMIVEYLGDDWLSTDLYMFQKVEKAVKHHCSLMKHMLPENKCMKRSLSKLSLPCEQQRPKVIKMMTDYASRYCTGEEPKDETMQMLKNNFASMTNIVGCLVTDGKLDFMVDNETDFWQTTLGLQFQMVMVACDLETVLYQVNMHIEQHFNGSNDAMHSDVFKDVQFLTQIAKKLGSPLRCAAKAMYPYCAAKGADITDFANKFLPHLSMMTMGIATFDAKKMDFKTPKNFASTIRKAVMIFGDPHLVTLQSKDESDLQTCNELMSFANPETPLVSSEQSLLIANDFYKVWARMGKFAEDKTGTYLHEVVVDFLLHGKDVRKMTDETHNHMFFSTDGGLEPEFSFIDANDGGITKSQEKQVDKYGKGKTVHIEGTAAANGKNVITIKDDQSGTMMVISNPYGSVLSVLLRASEDLLGISSGLLIEGCMDSAERSEMTEDLEEGTDEEKARRKRNTDKCLEMCGGLSGTMLDTCLYDCMQAEGTAFQDAVADAAGDLEAIEQSAAQEDAALIETAEVEEIDEALMAPIATTMGAPAEFFFAEPEATTVLFEVNDDFTTPAFVQVAPLVMGENGSVVVPPVQTPEPKTTVPATLPPATTPPPATSPPTSTPPPPLVAETQPGPQTEPTTKPQTDPPTVFPNEFETLPIPGMLNTDSIKPSTMAPPDSDLHNRKPAYVPQTGMKNYPTVRLAERVYNALDLTKRCEKNLLSHLTLGVCWSRLSG